MNNTLKSLALAGLLAPAAIVATAQTHTGVFWTTAGNTTYHQFTRDGVGAAVYINQISTSSSYPILRLSRGTASANQNVVFTVENNGSVGIGTTSPQERLSVNGNIRAKEIKVEITNWPDYVFQEGYDLMPLSELESHIKQHGHLPGIPSAREAEADGIGLAEMNRKLLEKVEELTLHLIEREKSGRLLEAELRATKRDVRELRDLVKAMAPPQTDTP